MRRRIRNWLRGILIILVLLLVLLFSLRSKYRLVIHDLAQTQVKNSTSDLTNDAIAKVTGEMLSDYYFRRYGVDTRSVRFPGLISNLTLPGGGTTDYAVEIYYAAVKGEKFVCPIEKGTFMDMMYMPDALDAMVNIMEANPDKLVHRNSFNLTSMAFDPEIIYNSIKKYIPDFEMEYKIDPIKQAIASSWPNRLDDPCARNEWGWSPKYDLDKMTVDMIESLRKKMGL